MHIIKYIRCIAKNSIVFSYRYRETDSKASNWNWIELPVNPPDARKVKIHNLTPRTKYEFQVIGMNEFGDGMYSEIIEAQTKGKFLKSLMCCFLRVGGHLPIRVFAHQDICSLNFCQYPDGQMSNEQVPW